MLCNVLHTNTQYGIIIALFSHTLQPIVNEPHMSYHCTMEINGLQ